MNRLCSCVHTDFLLTTHARTCMRVRTNLFVCHVASTPDHDLARPSVLAVSRILCAYDDEKWQKKNVPPSGKCITIAGKDERVSGDFKRPSVCVLHPYCMHHNELCVRSGHGS